MGNDEGHFNVSVIVRDSVQRPQLLMRKESRSGFEPKSFCHTARPNTCVCARVRFLRLLLSSLSNRSVKIVASCRIEWQLELSPFRHAHFTFLPGRSSRLVSSHSPTSHSPTDTPRSAIKASGGLVSACFARSTRSPACLSVYNVNVDHFPPLCSEKDKAGSEFRSCVKVKLAVLGSPS